MDLDRQLRLNSLVFSFGFKPKPLYFRLELPLKTLK